MSLLAWACVLLGIAEAYAQALRGTAMAAVLAMAAVVALMLGHTPALELGLRAYTEALLGSHRQDLAAGLCGWAGLMLMGSYAAPTTVWVARLLKVLRWLPSPIWMLALLLTQATLYQQIDGVAYAALSSLLGLAALSVVFLLPRIMRRALHQPLQGLVAAGSIGLAVVITAQGSQGPAVALPLSLDSLAWVSLLMAGLILVGAVHSRYRRPWL